MPLNRRDGYVDKTITGMNNILLDLKPNRCDSEVYINDKVDVTEFCKFIDKLKKEGNQVTYFHGMSFIIAKTIYSKPLLNRFIANRTCYMHKDVSLAFTAKTEFTDQAIEYLTVLKVEPEDNLLSVSKRLKEKVDIIRSKKSEGGANDIIDTVGFSPKPIRKTIVGMMKFLDRHGWLPKSLIEGNLYYSSCILSNIGTFKTGAIHHNLANFGTASALITFGEIREENKRKYMEVGITIDERIADGFYFCKSLRLIEYLFAHPEFMMDEASTKVSIPKEER